MRYTGKHAKQPKPQSRKRGLRPAVLAALLMAVLVAAVAGVIWGAEAGVAYAKEIGNKNEQACDACNKVKSGTAPDGYTTIPDGLNVGDHSVYRGGSSLSGWDNGNNPATFLDSDANTFAKPLPYGDVYIDTTKMNFTAGNKNNFTIEIGDSRFKWISSGSPITDAAYSDSDPTAHISTTDPMGQGRGVAGASSSIAYVGPLQSYLPDIKDAATNSGHTNDITPEGEYLYRITYKNAATLPNGTKGDVVITATGAQIEASYTVDSTHPRKLSDDSGEYSYDKALIVVHEGNELAVIGGLKDSSGNYINEYETVAKTQDEVQAHMDAAVAAGAKFNTGTWDQLKAEDKYIVNATGVILDLEIEIKDAEGQPVEGTISYAAHDLDIFTSQNAWGRPVTTGTSDDTKYAEGMTIKSGALSYALTPNYGVGGGIGNFSNISSGNQTDGWVEHGPFEAQPESPLLIEGGADKTANGVRFTSRGIAAIRGADGTFTDTPFTNTEGRNGYVVLASGQQYNSGGQVANSGWYTDTGQTYRPNAVVRNLMLGKAKNDDGTLVTNANNVNYRSVYKGVGNALWKTGRNDNPESFDTGFAVLLDSEKSELQWSGSYAHSGMVRTRLFDTTVFTYIEQTHGTGGGIYLEDYKLNDDCVPVGREGVVTMGKGADATVTAVPEEGYRIKEFQIGKAGLEEAKTYTLEDLGFTPGTSAETTVDGITFEMNTDGTVDVTFKDVQDPRHVHVDFTADYYFYKVWKGNEKPTKLELTAIPYAYIFTDVTLPAPAGTDPDAPYTDTHFSINGTEYTASDGTKYVLSPNNTLVTVATDGAGEPLVTLPYVLRGNNFESSDGSVKYPVTVKFGVNFAMGDGSTEDSVKQKFTVANETKYANYVKVLEDGGDISPGNEVWKIRYPAEGVSSLNWPALPIETKPAAHNVNHVERNYWFVTEQAPAGWSKEGYDNKNAEAPGVVPTIEGDYADYYDNHVWAAASEKDYAAATNMIQQENRTKNAFMSVFSKDAKNTEDETFGGEISNVPAVVVKGTKSWDDYQNDFSTRKEIWLHVDATVGSTTTKDVLPPQKLKVTTDESQTVTWGDLKVYNTDQAGVEIITNLADIPLTDAQGRRVTYTHEANGSYPASNGITYWLNELVKVDANGDPIQYTIRETLDREGTQKVVYANAAAGLVGYTAEKDETTWADMSKDGKTDVTYGSDTVQVLTYAGELENKLELTNFKVTKNWYDAKDASAHTKDEIEDKLTLSDNNGEVADKANFKYTDVRTTTPESGKTLTVEWKGLPAYIGKDGETVKAEYSVVESELAGYETKYVNTGDGVSETTKALNGGTINNTQKIKVNVVKIWDDADNQDGKRASIDVTLYQNGVAYEAEGVTNAATLAEDGATKSKTAVDDDTWTWENVFGELPYANEVGTTYNYTATETAKPDGYDSDQSTSQIVLSEWNDAKDTLTFKVTNKHDPAKISFTVTKVWNDANDKEGKRPSDTVSFELYQQPEGGSETKVKELPDGASTGGATMENGTINMTVPEASEGDSSSFEIRDLPKYAKAGKEITYTIKEVAVTDYNTEVAGDATTGFTVTNTHVPEPEATPLVTKDGQYDSSTGELKEQTVNANDAFTATGTLADGTPNKIEKIEMIDPTTGKPASSNTVTVPGEGTYVLDPTTGIVTFTPEEGFTGKGEGVTLRGTDTNGSTVDTTYTPIVVPNREIQKVERVIEYRYTDENGNEVVEHKTQTAELVRIGDYNPTLDDHPTEYQDTDPQTTIGFTGENNGWKPQDLSSVTSPEDEGGWIPDKDEIDAITGITPDSATALGFTAEVDPATGITTWKKSELVIYLPEPPVGGKDETWGFPGEKQDADAVSMFTVTTSKTAADDEGKREDNAINPDTIKLIDPETGEPTDEPVDAYATVDGERVKVGEYSYDPATGKVTFTPDEGFEAGADPEPVELIGTDKNGLSATSVYQPHFVPKKETVTISRTIDYVYDDGTPVLGEDGEPIVVTQEITFTREATSIDPETHEPVWGDWVPSSDTMPEQVSPTGSAIDREGYEPKQEKVDETDPLTEADRDKKADKYPDVTIVYTKPPVAGEKVTYGGKGETQKGTPPFTEGSKPLTSFTLIDPETGEPTDKITVPGEGSYTCDPETGEVTFVPEPDFTGKATTVTVRGTDENGYTADGYYTPNVVDNEQTETVKRTINYVYDDGEPVLDEEGNPRVVVEEKTFERTGKVDPETGTVTWPDWTPQSYEKVDSPEVPHYTPDQPVVDAEDTTPPDGDKTVTVVYSRTPYTVIYEDGDHGKSTGGKETKRDGETPQDNTTTPTSGYKFTGIFTYVITDNDGNVIDEGTTDDPKSITVIGNIVFTPQYRKLPVATYIDPATGRVIQQTLPFLDDDVEPAAPADPTRDGYEFVGWDREVDAEGNVTYKAKWKAVPAPADKVVPKTGGDTPSKGKTIPNTGDPTMAAWAGLAAAGAIITAASRRKREE